METTAVAAAPTRLFWDVIEIFWVLAVVWDSLSGSKNGLILSTYTTVDAIPTDWIITVVGLTKASNSGRALLTTWPSIILSVPCLVQLTVLSQSGLPLIPTPTYAFVSIISVATTSVTNLSSWSKDLAHKLVSPWTSRRSR